MNIFCQLSFEKRMTSFVWKENLTLNGKKNCTQIVLETGYFENDLYTTNIYGILQEIVLLFDIKMLLLPIKNRCDSLKK